MTCDLVLEHYNVKHEAFLSENLNRCKELRT